MTITVTHFEEGMAAAPPVGRDAERHLMPLPADVVQARLVAALRQAQDVVRRARAAVLAGHGMASNRHDIDAPESVLEAERAVADLRTVFEYSEEVPDGLLDAVDGALHEVQAASAALAARQGAMGVVDDAGVHLAAAESALEAIVPTAEATSRGPAVRHLVAEPTAQAKAAAPAAVPAPSPVGIQVPSAVEPAAPHIVAPHLERPTLAPEHVWLEHAGERAALRG
jgi:hypothetical protein